MTLKSVQTLLDVLHFADSHTAVIVPELGIRVTYASLRQQVLAMADALASAGIRPGDRVAIALPNGLPAIVSFLAASIAGTAAPLNPAYPYEEFLFFLGDTNARVLLCPPIGAEFARSAAADRKIPILSVEMTDQGNVHLVDAPTGASATEPAADDIALILHTSGSTGRPKRVPLRHFNLAVSSANIANSYALSEEDVSLCIMPLFHIHGLIGSTMATLLSGGTLVVPTKFNALSFWRTVRELRVTWFSGVPTMHQLLLARTHRKPVEAASLRFIRSCSAPFSPELIHKIEEIFGVPFVEAYGMTEAAHQMTSNPLPPRHRKPGSVGVGTGLRVRIMDKQGNSLENTQRGEIAIQGANVFRGYENNPEANARAFVNGWFRTGDQGYLDQDCYLHLTGRIKDIIIRGGENIAPHEVDEILLRHPAVAAAVTFGCAHPTLGEEVAAAVVLHEPRGATESALIKHCRELLAEYKCPKKIYLVKSIPTTATGKIRRRAVAAALVDDQRG
ncbi:MAG: AMP-dependent synthetase [Acidobacteria bacterium]|jgi:acyl-CoA synthetase (AMP-forming)/AMP-acid ligase II|nr:MAG: AMP-dependent synthetase [Acidobacteriota bacterium]